MTAFHDALRQGSGGATSPRVQLMGILNVTPDSFSDGGAFLNAQYALSHAADMVRGGADIIDIGAESSRPGFTPISAEEEMVRLAPVIKPVAALGRAVSIDTTKAKVAAYALDQGASLLNDIWGLQGDPEMAQLAAAQNVKIVVMHNRHSIDERIDIVADINAFFKTSFEIAQAAGLAHENIILDPGIGFGKSFEQNLIVLNRISDFLHFKAPLLVGASRKSFIGKIDGSSVDGRLAGTLAAHLHAVSAGASLLRVHDIADMRQALQVSTAISDAGQH